jgi:hypothetical protein
MNVLRGRAVCALCRVVLGAGMTVRIWPTRMYADFLAMTDRPALSDTENPVVTCRQCGVYVTAKLTEQRVQ